MIFRSRADPYRRLVLIIRFPQLSASLSALTEKWSFLCLLFVGVTRSEEANKPVGKRLTSSARC
jgi:hypothetical protein